MGYKITFFIIISFLHGHVLAENPQSPDLKNGQQQENAGMINAGTIAESEHVDAVLDLVKDKEIPMPIIEPPSAFMVWLRSFGIAVLYKYHAIKDWVAKKLGRQESGEK